jgi:branched-chain amino acid transport system permease protein
VSVLARRPLSAAWAIGGLVAAALLAVPFLGIGNYSLEILNSAAIAIIFAISLNLLYGYCGQISFGHAGFYAIGGYAFALLQPQVGLIPGLLASLLFGATISALIGLPLLRLRGHYLALGTLAFGIAVQVLALQWVDLTGGPWGISIDPPHLFGARLSRNYYYVVLAATVIAFVLSVNLVRSRYGRALQIIREDEAVARSLGVNTVLTKLSVFALSGALAALAGALYAGQNLFVTPALYGLSLSISPVVMVVLGGSGTPLGPVVGAIALTLLPEALHQFQEYHVLIYGLVLLFVLRFMPHGIVGLAQKAFSKRWRQAQEGPHAHPAH